MGICLLCSVLIQALSQMTGYGPATVASDSPEPYFLPFHIPVSFLLHFDQRTCTWTNIHTPLKIDDFSKPVGFILITTIVVP